MFRKLIRTVALFAVFAAPAAISAHDGHTHKVMGTVAAVSATQLEVTTTEGKKQVVSLNARTVYRQGKGKATLKALKVGDRLARRRSPRPSCRWPRRLRPRRRRRRRADRRPEITTDSCSSWQPCRSVPCTS
jgi:hypothetical protein